MREKKDKIRLKEKNRPQFLMQDLEDYYVAIAANDVDECLRIERRYELDGYPPGVVFGALHAGAEGEDIPEYLDRLIGG